MSLQHLMQENADETHRGQHEPRAARRDECYSPEGKYEEKYEQSECEAGEDQGDR